MTRFYLLAAHENIPFAEKLLEDFRNVKIVSKTFEGVSTENISSYVKKKLESASISDN